MNAQKFTQKSLEAITAAQSLATEYSNMQIEQLHLLGALTREDEGPHQPAAAQDGGGPYRLP